MTNQSLNYNNICWIPKFGKLNSRDDGNPSIEFANRRWKLPVVCANMETTISFEKARWLALNDYFYILHRFYPKNEIKKCTRFSC